MGIEMAKVTYENADAVRAAIKAGTYKPDMSAVALIVNDSEFSVDDIHAIGIKFKDGDADFAAAKADLQKRGVNVLNMRRMDIFAASLTSRYMDAAANNLKGACKIAGLLSAKKAWKTARNPEGKLYKSENAYFKDMFPQYAMSTINNYIRVGRQVYVPYMCGMFPDMPEIGEMSPSEAVLIAPSLEDEDVRKQLPAAFAEERKQTGKLTHRGIKRAVKAAKDAVGIQSANKSGDVSDSAGDIANQLSGGANSATIDDFLKWTRNGDNGEGDLTPIVQESKIADFLNLLKKASDDKELACAICAAMYKSAKAAK